MLVYYKTEGLVISLGTDKSGCGSVFDFTHYTQKSQLGESIQCLEP